jgi:phage protein D/phage baseplate assembly protein gpV
MSPATAEQHVASYDLLVDGQDIAQEQKDRVTEIRVVDHLRLPDACTIRVTYPRGDGVDTMPFAIGKAIEVRLGAAAALAPVTLFKGLIITIEVEFGAGGCAAVIRAYDRSHQLHRARHTRTFQNQTSSDIVQRLVAAEGLSVQTDSSGEPHEHIHQDNETDWDFIWRLADRIGFEFVVDDETAYFRAPKTDDGVALEWPTTLRSFRPRLTAVQQVQSVTLSVQDPKTAQAIESVADTPNQIAKIGVERATIAGALNGEAAVHISTEPVKSRAEGDALTQALLDRLANAYVAADGVAPGNPRIRAGAKIEVSGVGSTFSGTYRAATTTHILRGSGYQTTFANSPSHTILGAVGAADGSPRFGAQLVLGIVTNNDDPESMGRVKVSLPALGTGIESGWARVVTPGAGDQRGLVMLPVAGDEVLVGFEHGDTTRPYVLGGLFNGVAQPGDELTGNKDGSLNVLSDHEIILKSEEDFMVTAGKAFGVQVGSDGMSVASDGDLQETINGTITITGRKDVTIEGTMSLTLKCGAASIQLSSSGVSISGPTVNIG